MKDMVKQVNTENCPSENKGYEWLQKLYDQTKDKYPKRIVFMRIQKQYIVIGNDATLFAKALKLKRKRSKTLKWFIVFHNSLFDEYAKKLVIKGFNFVVLTPIPNNNNET